ncbi:MAG: TIGR03013 family XrtA/PEP-CTERM system glycosyltransferase [Gammaproteobacteria bacterium]
MAVRILNHYVHMQVFLLGALEFCALIGGVYAGVYLRFAGDMDNVFGSVGTMWHRALFFAVVIMLSMTAMGLYHARLRPRRSGIAVRLIVSFIFGGGALVLFFYLVPSLYVGRGALALALALGFVMISIVRTVFFSMADDEIFKRRILVFGAGEKAASILGLRRRSDRRGFAIHGFVKSNEGTPHVELDRILDIPGSMSDYAIENDLDEIVVAIDDRRRGVHIPALLDAKLSGIRVTDALSFFERETGKVRLDLLYPSWLIYSDGFDRGFVQQVMGRVFDVVFSLILLLVALPFMLAVIVAIKLEDGWGAPVLYRQTRVGFKGKPFDVLKFRSMTTDAERDGVAQWAQKNDSRVTKVGAVIRKYRLDELPQVLNVLRNEMSFVGPRPERPSFVEELSEKIPYYSERHCVKPGITGWAQLCYEYGASMEDSMEKLQYDLYYVKNRTLLFDLMVMLQTAEVVLWKSGAR